MALVGWKVSEFFSSENYPCRCLALGAPVVLVGRKVADFFSEENCSCECFGASWHQLHWLEGKFLIFFRRKTVLAKVLVLVGTSCTGWKEIF